MKKYLYTFLLLFDLLLVSCSENMKVVGLSVENVTTPRGIDVERPRFSWRMLTPDDSRDRNQAAYQIIVRDEEQRVVWDSGKVISDKSMLIDYLGESLEPTTHYIWEVSVHDWDGNIAKSESWFETGFLDSSLSAWGGAEWIGGNDTDLILQAQYQSVFRLRYDIRLDENSNSTRASFVLGANDYRLLDKIWNLYGLENELNESYVLLTLDIGPLTTGTGTQAKIDIYRVGYHPDDTPNIPLHTFNIPSNLVNRTNMYQVHSVEIELLNGLFDLYIDGKSDENKITITDAVPSVPDFNNGKVYNLNPVGSGGDYICFPVLAEIGFSCESNQTAYFSNVEVANYRSPYAVLSGEATKASDRGIYASYINKGLTIEGESFKVGSESATFIVADPSCHAAPMLRTTFEAEKTVKKARLYVTARGIYDLYMNGKRINDSYFNPGLTQYNKTHLYQTYDVTSLVKSGDNALGAVLGEGWWSGPATFIGAIWNFFGDRQSLLAKLVLTYQDGTEKTIVSNDTWKYFSDGPIRLGSFFQGEVYDATREAVVKDWSTASYNDEMWKNAPEHQGDGFHFTTPFDLSLGFAEVTGYEDMRFVGGIDGSPQVVTVLTAQSVNEISPHVFIYDMGQNMVGVPEIKVKGNAGDRIVLRYAEVLYPDLPEYSSKKGMLMTENLRAAMVRDIYTLKGGEEVISPRFTFHGYRYIEISGMEQALPLSSVKGKVISSIHSLTSEYITSNEEVNRLWQNITWSSLGNFISIPTDCPQRNERMGWSGDISVFVKTATYMGNMNAFLDRHALALRDTQADNGRYTDVAPLGSGFGGVLWGSAGITVPWETYNQYGDIEVLRKHYPSMKAYMDYFASTIDPETNSTTDGALGDWLSPVDLQNDNNLFFEAYYIYELEIMSKVAMLLGADEDASAYAALREQRKTHFHNTYLNEEKFTIHSGITSRLSWMEKPQSRAQGDLIDTQASYAVPLALNVINENDRAEFAEHFAQTVRRENKDDTGTVRPTFSLLTGFIGTAWISSALSENGYDTEAYRLLTNNQYPSWLYPVEQGATTIWERLNSYTKTDGFGGNNGMNSFNHYSFGAVGAWLINHSLGIQRDENNPGFKHFILEPIPDPDKQMTFAEGYYDSYYGRIRSKWTYAEDMQSITYTFGIPANSSATLYLPEEGDIEIPSNPKGMTEINTEDNRRTFELKSGNYTFVRKL